MNHRIGTVITAGAADGVHKVIGLAVGSAVLVAIVEWWTQAYRPSDRLREETSPSSKRPTNFA